KAAAEKAAADKAAAAKAAAERAAARAASRREAEPQVERKSESAAKPAKAELASSGDAKLDKATAGVDPSLDATDLYYLGKRQLESGQRDAAIISLTASLQRRPSDRTRALLGRALFDAGRMSEAEKVLKRAPRHADALLLLATLYQHRGRVSDARRTYQAFLTHHADHQKAAWVRDLLRTL
ncbi:MAG: Tetratricopeptide repeat, partial [Pseudomonadota bacterium]